MHEFLKPKMLLMGLVAFLVPVACVFAMKWEDVSASFECNPEIGTMIHLYAPG